MMSIVQCIIKLGRNGDKNGAGKIEGCQILQNKQQ